MFFFGQHIVAVCRMRDFVFLDKLCIHQTDDDLKAAGIKGLAGFLRASKRLVLLWTPRYFSRLWCTYELVAWCHLHGLDSSRIRFLPVAWSVVHCLMVFATSLYLPLHVPVKQLGLDINVVRLTCFVLLLPLIYKISGLIRELILVENQIRRFAIRDSECFCCTHKHRHPETGQPMSCDRELVYATLLQWHLGDDENIRASYVEAHGGKVDESLDCFDRTVRQDMARVVSQSLNSPLLCQSYTDWVSTCIPVVWGGLDTTFENWRAGRSKEAARWLQEYSLVPLFIFPLTSVAWIKSVRMMERATANLQRGRLRGALSGVVCTFVFAVIVNMLLLPGMFLITEGDTLTMQDAVLLLRFISLAFLTARVACSGARGDAQEQVASATRSEKGDSLRSPLGHNLEVDHVSNAPVKVGITLDQAGHPAPNAPNTSPGQTESWPPAAEGRQLDKESESSRVSV
eukprot:TRINITY_DN37061_c0_g1_i1.p1 TRINITY_DN37061_c0_g1~~TRINITY_DN37061_c0_g1_i1.p1  ORF type:complete len:533 (-),score=21.01 TRINITY_DN37061_c0_g1_i1:239-1612(-)